MKKRRIDDFILEINKIYAKIENRTCKCEIKIQIDALNDNMTAEAQLATRNCGCIARLKEPSCAIGTTLDFWLHTDGRWPAYAEGLTR